MNKTVFLYAIILSVYSCASGTVDKNGGQQLLSVLETNSESSYFMNHFEIAEIVPIQTNEAFLVPDVKRLIRYKDKIILLSAKNNQILVINANNGKVENCINRQGTGPGESRKILDIAFDESSGQIVAYNDYYKLLFFDLEGKYLSEVKVGELYEEMAMENGKIIFFNKLDGYSCYPYMLNVFDVKNKTWSEIGRNDKIDFAIRSQGNLLVKSKRVWFNAPLDFGLFLYEKQEAKSPYKLNLSASSLNKDLIKESISDPQVFFRKVMDGDLIYGFNSIRETKDYLVFRSNQSGLFILNKGDNKVYRDRVIEDRNLGMNIVNYYYPHGGDDDKILFVLSPEIYFTHRQLATEDSVINRLDSLNIKEEDNPILIFYKEKG